MRTQEKVLITGADGFIGSHLAETLVKCGYDVTTLCQYNSFGNWGWLEHSPLKEEFDVHLGDIRDTAFVAQLSKGKAHIVHLAALIAIPYSYSAAQSYVDTNVSGTLSVLQAALQHECSVIHTSTSEVYGSAQYVPIDEGHQISAQSPYAATKIAADQLAMSYHKSFELPVKIVRPFNTYGPRQSSRAVIPTIISQLANRSAVIKLGSVSTRRDFNFVDDTISGFVSALRVDKGIGEVINIGSGFDVSIYDVAMEIGNIFGSEVRIETMDERVRPEASEVDRLLACNKKAQDLLGWTPNFAGLDGLRKGLRLTCEWFCKPENLAIYKPGLYAK